MDAFAEVDLVVRPLLLGPTPVSGQSSSSTSLLGCSRLGIRRPPVRAYGAEITSVSTQFQQILDLVSAIPPEEPIPLDTTKEVTFALS